MCGGLEISSGTARHGIFDIVSPRARRNPGCAEADTEFPVVTGAGSHPFPFRTRKLSLLPPMVLRGKLRGRVGRCREFFPARRSNRAPGFFFVRQRPAHAALHALALARRSGAPRRSGGCAGWRLAALDTVRGSVGRCREFSGPTFEQSVGLFRCTPAPRTSPLPVLRGHARENLFRKAPALARC